MMLRKNFYTILLFIMCLLPASLFAQDLVVDFEALPLFSEASLMPGTSVERTVSVTNEGAGEQDVYVSVQNEFYDEFADVLTLSIRADGGVYYTGTFTDFFSQVPISLGELGEGDTRVYTFIITFEDVENSYQQKTLGFDLVIGFVGGESVSDSVSSSHGVREDEGVVAGAVTEKQSLIERVQTYVSSFFDDEIGGEVKEVQIENVEKEGVENSSEEMVVVYDQSKDSSEEEGGVSIALILLIIVAIIIVVILLLPR